MSGSLWLLPVALGDTAWEGFLPPATRDDACRLNHFVVENSKTARAELKRLGHPRPLRELAIEQLPEKLNAAEIERLLAPLLAVYSSRRSLGLGARRLRMFMTPEEGEDKTPRVSAT